MNQLADYIFSLTGMSSLRALPRETVIQVLNGGCDGSSAEGSQGIRFVPVALNARFKRHSTKNQD